MKQLKREDDFMTSPHCSGLADDTMLNTPTGTNIEFARIFGGHLQKPGEAPDKQSNIGEATSQTGTFINQKPNPQNDLLYLINQMYRPLHGIVNS